MVDNYILLHLADTRQMNSAQTAAMMAKLGQGLGELVAARSAPVEMRQVRIKCRNVFMLTAHLMVLA